MRNYAALLLPPAFTLFSRDGGSGSDGAVSVVCGAEIRGKKI